MSYGVVGKNAQTSCALQTGTWYLHELWRDTYYHIVMHLYQINIILDI